MKNKLADILKFPASAFVLALSGCSDLPQTDQTGPVEKTVNVVVEAVQFSNEQTRIEAVGTSRALQSVDLTPETSGEVTAVNFESGQRVEQGDVLLELDNRDQLLAVELARIRMEEAQRLYDRYQRTDDSGAVLPTTVDAARAALESARVEYDRARVALDDRTVKAPFSGHVGISQIDVGDRIGPDTQITTLDNRDALLVRFEVPESLSGALQPGDRIEIDTWNNSVTAAYGDIEDIGSRIDPVTRTFTVRARVDNTADVLRPGMSFRVSLDIKGEPYPIIPEIAIQWGTEGSYVWSITGNQVFRVPATIVQRQQGQVLVDADLREGRLVVVEGIQRMYEGIKVNYTVRDEKGLEKLTSNMTIGNLYVSQQQ